MDKTNALRILDSKHIAYEVKSYDVSDGHIDGESVAKKCSKYDPQSPILCAAIDENDKITERKVKSLKEQQLSIFDL